MLRVSIAAIVMVTFSASAQNIETLGERSQSAAREVLDRAVQAMGGAEALRSIEVVQLQLEGETTPRLQMPTAAAPFESGTMRETLLIDFKNNRLRLEQRVVNAGFENHNTIVLGANGGTNYDHRARTATPIPPAQANQQQFIQYYRRLPNLLLRQALDRTSSLRSLGRDTFNGQPHEVITFVMPDTQQVALYIDASTNLISKYELLTPDPLLGEEASEIMFGDYATVGKFRVPTSWSQRLAGDVISKFRLRAELNPTLGESSFAAPSGKFANVAPAPDLLKEEVEKLADGVFILHNIAAQNYNTLAVEMKDHIVVVEAPLSSDSADRAIAKIKEIIPGKPIRYVAVTHHHSDHMGGLRSFIAEGATVITTQGNRAVVDATASGPVVDRLAKAPRKLEVQFVEKGKRVLTDGTRTVELIDVGPNPHAKEMLIAYLPRERVLFQGDLLFIPANEGPPGPPQASTASFAKRLKELNLQVERIGSVHGRTSTIAEFEKAMQEQT